MNHQVNKIKNWQSQIFWTVLNLSVFCVLSYVYLVNNVVFNLASRESLKREQIQLSLDLSQLETRFLALSDSITIARAYALGFEEAGSNVSFAAAPLPVIALGLDRGYEE